MPTSRASSELRALIQSSVDELDSWLSQEIQDEFGTRAYILRAIAWCRRGALARARADVDAALTKGPAHEIIELTGAVILYVTRDYDRAVVLLDRVARRHRYMAAQTLRVLVARVARLGWTTQQREAQQMLAALGVRDLRAHVQGLQRSRAPRPPQSTQTEAELEVAAQQGWARLFEHGPEDVARRLDALLEASPSSTVAAGLRARLFMLLGRHAEAATALTRGDRAEPTPPLLDEHMALALASADPDAVITRALDDSSSARAWRLRAEALLELGDLEQADLALTRAAEQMPRHALTELLRVLVARAGGQEPSAAQFLELYDLAPGLLSDAARELELPLWVDGGIGDDQPHRAQLGRVCEHARTLLTADRSSRPISYRTTSGLGRPRLRHILDADAAAKTHACDAEDLAKAAQLLLRSIEKRRGGPLGAHRATATRSLDTKQIEDFMADGYVHLRGAFPRELAESLVASAHRRLQQDPARCLNAKDTKHAAAKLAGYDPDDPRTWPDGRIDVLGERTFAIHEFSPLAERAIFQLLGDAARVRTRKWTTDLIAQYPRHQRPHTWIPGPTQESWHVDSPTTNLRIDNILTGLLVFTLYSDLQTASGNSWMALDSPAKVARALAAAPEGLDFCHDDTGPAITQTCERFIEVTGEAGDLFLVHPLMLHSASPNPSPRIRFMSNPMIYVQEPLDHRRPDPSPVEQVIARALASV